MIVISIISLISAISLPKFSNIRSEYYPLLKTT
ncbi:hypothetical protein [Ilyobacter sp.]